MTTFKETVAQQVVAMCPSIIDKAASVIAEQATKAALDALVKCEATLHSLEKEFAKIKPDFGGYVGADGVEVKPTSYTKATYEQRAKLGGKIKHLSSAMDKAIVGLSEGKLSEADQMIALAKGGKDSAE
jgi:hypothetical protein